MRKRYIARVVLLISLVFILSLFFGCNSEAIPGEWVAKLSPTSQPNKITPTVTRLAQTPTLAIDLMPTAPIMMETQIPFDNTATIPPTTSDTPVTYPDFGPFKPFVRNLNRQLSAVKKLIKGPDGNVWVVGVDEVTIYDGENWLFHGEIAGHPLGFDGVGRFWIVDEDGEWISAYDGNIWTTYGSQQGWLPAGRMFNVEMYASVSDGIVTDTRGDAWLVTVHDVRVLHDDQWILYTPGDVGFEPSSFMLEAGFGFLLSDVSVDSTGDVWVSDCAWMGPGPEGQGARWFDGEVWSGQSSPVVSTGCIKDVEVGTDGRIWAGVDHEIWLYTPGHGWKLIPHPVQFPLEGMRWGWIIDLLLDGTDAAWITMVACGGASCDSGQSVTFWVSEDEWLVVGENGIPDVALGGNALKWGCFAHGLYQVSGGVFIPVDEKLPSECQIEADKTGRVWLSLAGESTLWVFDGP